jgi:ATP-dependent Clp protease ATP-binding subunit ClpC
MNGDETRRFSRRREMVRTAGCDPEQGARLMRRAVERYLTDPLADGILEGRIRKGTTLKVSSRGGKLTFNV